MEPGVVKEAILYD